MNPVSENEPSFLKGGPGFAALVLVSLAMVTAGTAAFLYSVLAGDSPGGWQIFLSNYVFWTGLSFGSVFLISLMNLTGARWIRPFKRLAEAPAAFLPFSWLLFWLIYWGRRSLLPWVTHPVPEKAPYLNVNFFFAREGIGIFLLAVSALALVYFSVKGDREVLGRKERTGPTPNGRLWKAQFAASIVFAGLYVLILTLFSWDLVMSLSPEWVSTLFGPYFFMGSIYTGVAGLALSAGIAFYATPLREYAGPMHFYSLGVVLFAFLMVFGDFFFSQYLLIWYGNKPEETRFLIERFRFAPWKSLSIAAGVMSIGLPFVSLLVRKVKQQPLALSITAFVILIGMWLERFVLVVPSLQRLQAARFGWVTVLISLGFFGLMTLSMLVFLRRYPLLALSDPLLGKGLEMGGRSE